ncbi:VWA domain-containing protein [Halopseudomonas yangmingensis]|uniref:von Willebrand factor type A domain-containing protein n=1 Tax=Halopseudomonas yangmingensis TaxID=1720063 RepID=A0A1I4P7X8_9GAMM|nr:VWA domain-containing protein [Halopseudomonas yangmingensis]SFM23700.1 von Willebrand factor type A domain-containing protein [Halopseudomonas yangmingensis]
MQRIARDGVIDPQTVARLNARVALIKQHFPPSIANLFALPRTAEDGAVEWWTPLAGQPLAFASLAPEARDALLDSCRQRQQAIQLLADSLDASGRQEQAKTLRSLLATPDPQQLFSINGDPVLIGWGDLPGSPAAAPPSAADAGRRLWPWLLLALLFLLALLLWWLADNGYLSAPGERQPLTPAACRPAGAEPPEFTVVLDTSGSMELNIATSSAEERRLLHGGARLSPDHPDMRRLLSPPSRLDVAKQSFTQMIGQLHGDIDMRLITFAGCDNLVDHGIFPRSQRAQLTARIGHFEADGGTPLGASLQAAAKRMDGRQRDAVLVLFIDGEDGCGMDVCQIASRIARKQPRLRINLVNLGDSTESNCIAESTGGRVYSSRDSSEVAVLLGRATAEVAGNASCTAAGTPGSN